MQRVFCPYITKTRTQFSFARFSLNLWRQNRFYSGSISDTVYALSTFPGKAGVAIIRVSGNQAYKVIERMTDGKVLSPRFASFRQIKHPTTEEVLDRGLVLWFPGPHSFTGEDTVELHIHGGNAVVKGILEALGRLAHFRIAEQGEFARRAFGNDKLDLTELEGLADLLNAETEMQRRLALRQSEGGLRVPFEKWREIIIRCMATIEAVIDFGEDEQIEEGVLDHVYKDIAALKDLISQHLDDAHVGEIVRDGVQVVIFGPPNAGKSSLLNRLAKRDAAIVSNVPGTTRDVLEVTLNLKGYPVIMSDTAGLRASEDPIEMEGIKRALTRSRTADIKICMLSVDKPGKSVNIDPILLPLIDKDTLVVINKADQLVSFNDAQTIVQDLRSHLKGTYVCTISCKTNDGIDHFLSCITERLQERLSKAFASPVIITQQRHRQNLEACKDSLDTFLDMQNKDIVISAEELRQAAASLGRITGKIDVETVLDALFGQFCIGK